MHVYTGEAHVSDMVSFRHHNPGLHFLCHLHNYHQENLHNDYLMSLELCTAVSKLSSHRFLGFALLSVLWQADLASVVVVQSLSCV